MANKPTNKTIRVFTVEVSNCCDCHHSFTPLEVCQFGEANTEHEKRRQSQRFVENYHAITPTCPRYGETKLIEVKE